MHSTLSLGMKLCLADVRKAELAAGGGTAQTGWAWFDAEEQNKSPVTETLKDTMSRK